MTRVVHLQKAKTVVDNDKTLEINYVPCKIHSDGNAKVSTYFSPYINKDNKKDDCEQLKASFRGYPLTGKVISLPENYKGLILQETLNSSSEDKDRNLYTTHVFDKLTYWNWDKQPSQNDAFIAAFDWIDIAEAIHSPVPDDS